MPTKRAVRLLTLNAGLLRIGAWGGRALLEPARGCRERLAALPAQLATLNADVVLLQEVYGARQQAWLSASLQGLYPHAVASARMPGRTRWRLVPPSLMLLSRYPVAAARFLPFARASRAERWLDSKGCQLVDLVDTPIGPLRVLNLHTTAGLHQHPEHPQVDAVRAGQIQEAMAALAPGCGRWSRVLAGDFNCGPAVDEPAPVAVEDRRPAQAWPQPLQGQGACGGRVSLGNYRLLPGQGWADTFTTLGLARNPPGRRRRTH